MARIVYTTDTSLDADAVQLDFFEPVDAETAHREGLPSVRESSLNGKTRFGLRLSK